jgi:hypothetical protein
MTLIDCLKKYKEELIGLGYTFKQKKFLEDAFSRWYIGCSKIGNDGIFPKNSLINNNLNDLLYANKTKHMKFNVYDMQSQENLMHNKYSLICKALIQTDENYVYLDNVITKNQLKRLKDLYIGDKIKLELYINKLINLYNFIGTNNMHLSIPPIFEGIELFGSPINTHNSEYCSPFVLEKYFGSLGSFWDYKFHKNSIYLCNPPFDEIIIKNMANKLIDDLKKTKYKVIIVITIPVWDSETQKQVNITNYGLKFEGYDILMNCKYFKDHQVLDKDNYSYWNYYTEQKAPASWTHLIILSNLTNYKSKFSIESFTKQWREF